MRIEQLDEWALKCMTDDGPKLGFPTGIANRRFSSADTVAIRNSQGIVIDSAGKSTPWPIEKFIEHEGNMVAVGPWLEGTRPFNDAVVDLKMLSRLQPAIRVLKAAGFPFHDSLLIYHKAARDGLSGKQIIYASVRVNRHRESETFPCRAQKFSDFIDLLFPGNCYHDKIIGPDSLEYLTSILQKKMVLVELR